jgi:hypothetical protein
MPADRLSCGVHWPFSEEVSGDDDEEEEDEESDDDADAGAKQPR